MSAEKNAVTKPHDGLSSLVSRPGLGRPQGKASRALAAHQQTKSAGAYQGRENSRDGKSRMTMAPCSMRSSPAAACGGSGRTRCRSTSSVICWPPPHGLRQVRPHTQPWRVYVLTGEARARLSALILQERATATGEPAPEYQYYPASWPEPYLTRRRTIGWQLYGLLGIVKGDRAAARAWHDQNFSFFGAPVGMMFTLDRRLGIGSYLDIGMFMQSIMIAGRGLGLDTCPQAAFAGYHEIIRRELALPPEELLLCGMALGWADHGALANTIESERAALDQYAVFRD